MKVITNDSQTLQSMFEGQLSIFSGVSEDQNYTDGKKKKKTYGNMVKEVVKYRRRKETWHQKIKQSGLNKINKQLVNLLGNKLLTGRAINSAKSKIIKHSEKKQEG